MEIVREVVPQKPIRTALINMDTGEPIEGTPIMPRAPTVKHFKRDYIIMFQEALAMAVKDPTVKMEELRVYLFVASEVAMGNWLHMSQKEIGEQLGMKQSNVSKAFKSLTARGWLETSVQLGKSKAYRLSPDNGWRGAGPVYTQEIRSRKKASHLSRVK